MITIKANPCKTYCEMPGIHSQSVFLQHVWKAIHTTCSLSHVQSRETSAPHPLLALLLLPCHCHLQNSRVPHCNWAMHIHQGPPLCSLQSGYPCHTVPRLSLSQWPLHPGVSLLLGGTFLTELSWPLPVLRLSDSPSPLHAFKTGTAWEILTLWSSTTSMKCSIYCLWPTAPM